MAATDINIASTEQKIWNLLEEVSDPEIPVLSVIDLGIVRHVTVSPENEIIVTITPTYSGCPAMDMISMNIRMHLIANGFPRIKIVSVLSPAWTTDWMSDAGKDKLKQYGIAAPHASGEKDSAITCPQCNSDNTKLLSQFGSTACKALYQCNDCKEPFDYFKCH